MNTFEINITPAERPPEDKVIDHDGRLWATDGAGMYDLALWPQCGVNLGEDLVGYRWVPRAEIPDFGALLRSMMDTPAVDLVVLWRIQDETPILRGADYYAFDARFMPILGRSKIEIVRLDGLKIARCWVDDRVVALLASMRSEVKP